MSASPIDAVHDGEPLPAQRPDYAPLIVVVLVILAAWPAIGSTSSWVTLTVAGLAMGMIIFIAAAGLTLVFGLMDVLNFGHGVFITIGAFMAATLFAPLRPWTGAPSLLLNLAALLPTMAVAMLVAAAVGVVFERLLIRPVYGQHLKQILITTGGLVIGQELIKLIWGPDAIELEVPQALRGAFVLGDAAVEKYRVFALALGLVVFALMLFALHRTKLGLLVRAGVEDGEMVESLGYPVRRLFVVVFVAGSALAGLGGVLWGLYQQNITAQIGAQLNVLIFIVIIIGGLGSTAGSFIGAILVGLVANYTGFVAPKLALFSNISLMVLVLLWRPSGLFPVSKR